MGKKRYRGPAVPEDEIAAYHEAGHAVMAMLLGTDVKFATIEPSMDPKGRDRGGHTEIGPFAGRDVLHLPETDPAVGAFKRRWDEYHAAGAAAECLRFRTYWPVKQIVDREELAGSPIQSQTADGYFDELVRAAADQLQPAWDGVEAVASGLIQHRTLSGSAVRHLSGITR